MTVEYFQKQEDAELKLLPDQVSDGFENQLFKDFKQSFATLEESFFKEFDNIPRELSVEEIGKRAKAIIDDLVGEPIQKYIDGQLDSVYSSFANDFNHLTLKLRSRYPLEHSKLLTLQSYLNWIKLLKFGSTEDFEKQRSATPTLYSQLINNLSRVAVKSGAILDSINKLDLVEGQFLENLQGNAVHYRRWRIVTNRLTKTIKNRVKSQIDQCIKEKRDYRCVESGIKSTFEKYNKGEAYNTRTIARTETYSVVRHTEWQYAKRFEKALGIKLEKSWETRFDEKVRENHKNYRYGGDRKVNWLGFNDYFTGNIHGESTKIRYPLDTIGIAGDVINCRCRLKLRKSKR